MSKENVDLTDAITMLGDQLDRRDVMSLVSRIASGTYDTVLSDTEIAQILGKRRDRERQQFMEMVITTIMAPEVPEAKEKYTAGIAMNSLAQQAASQMNAAQQQSYQPQKQMYQNALAQQSSPWEHAVNGNR